VKLFSDSVGLANFPPVRKYHSNYYVPHNLALIVAGKLSSGTSSLLRVVQDQIEPSLISHGQSHGSYPPGWKRPFVETASAVRNPIPATTKHTIEFPEKDECMCFHCSFRVFIQGKNPAMGELIINFLGPLPNEHLTRKVCLLTSIVFISSFFIGNRCTWDLLNVFGRCPSKQRICGN
jgi:hypothetical protein